MRPIIFVSFSLFCASFGYFSPTAAAQPCVSNNVRQLGQPFKASVIEVEMGDPAWNYLEVKYQVRGKTTQVNIQMTRRPLSHVIADKDFPPNHLSFEGLKNKSVLDVSVAHEELVEDLRAKGIRADKVDIEVPPQFAQKPYFKETPPWNMSGIQEGTYDRVVSFWSFFYYETPPEILRPIISEMLRVTKKGGKILLSPVSPEAYEIIQQVVPLYKGAKIWFDQPQPFMSKAFPNAEKPYRSLVIAR